MKAAAERVCVEIQLVNKCVCVCEGLFPQNLHHNTAASTVVELHINQSFTTKFALQLKITEQTLSTFT